MTRFRRKVAFLATSLLALGALAGCGSDDSAGGSAVGSGSSTGDDGSASKGSFTFAMTTPGVGNAPLLAALDAMREDGYEIDTPILAEVSLAIEGLFRGEFQFSSGSTSAAMLATAKGSPIKVIGDRSGNEWGLVTQAGIETCEDLDGARLAWHATNGSASVMTRQYLAEECPGTEPEFSILQGSSNRATALVADRIDATPLELFDIVSLQQTNADDINLLTSFAETVPNLLPAAIYGNSDFMAENPQVAVDLLVALIEQHRRVAEEDGYLASIAKEYLPDYDSDLLDLAAPMYVELGIFDVNGGLDEESLSTTLAFFQETEEDLADLTPADVGDLTFIEEALEELGRA